MQFKFKQENQFKDRKSDADEIRSKYFSRIPVIVERVPGSKIPDVDKQKYLVPTDLSVEKFYYLIRKRIGLRPEDALFFFINDTVPRISDSMGFLYKEHKEDDSFLYIAYSNENIFDVEAKKETNGDGDVQQK